MSQPLDLDTLLQACTPGGASVLVSTTELAPAAGEHGGIAPARFTSGRSGTYAFETRNLSGEAVTTVLIDSKQSQSNRQEDALNLAREAGDEALSQMPQMLLTYSDDQHLTDTTAPHRAFDGHFRAGTIGGQPVTQHPTYIAARNATLANARALLELSPVSLLYGAWDATRKSHQARFRTTLVGEIIGVLTDQSDDGVKIAKRGGARRDEVSPSVQLSGDELEQILSAQEAELSPTTVKDIRDKIKRAKTGKVSGSVVGLGSIPPSLEALGLVSCSQIIRSHVLTFSALRQLRFGSPGAGDVACRALLAALGLYGLTLANQELVLRANCDLVEAEPTKMWLDGRYGTRVEISVPTPAEAKQLLLDAAEHAKAEAGIRWEGQEFAVVGNPAIARGAIAEDPED
ncbi:type I-G CRISPR-associated RAMP protein Csb1/Cas7g [Parenemella sanctibonifatiensis]|uniref:Type I-U CRISPR-associated protein Cas7 n=1 Tax=Parenemella sanctibonifatiensis TaxID=2016505 RepID=A0A255EJ18_9ACTN|nr:type I-U CRISPR-associated RAMP protein Csb1/Cas7u [Parenemella sanctibonifatiensis]OYN91528.1 type I-U CRISPR-associated protein Cas7 [Parenemella sanctibonifatiensis]